MAPRVGSTGEDDGYLVTITSDMNRDLSECLVFDARRLADGPIVRVRLPERVSSGTHSTWAPGSAIPGWTADRRRCDLDRPLTAKPVDRPPRGTERRPASAPERHDDAIHFRTAPRRRRPRMRVHPRRVPGVPVDVRIRTAPPLILSGHNGGLHKREPRLVARARHMAAQYGFAVAAIDAPGSGERPRSESRRAVPRRPAPGDGGRRADRADRRRPHRPAGRASRAGMAHHPRRPPGAARDRRPGRVHGHDRHRHSARRGRSAHPRRQLLRPGFRTSHAAASRLVRSPSRCCS